MFKQMLQKQLPELVNCLLLLKMNHMLALEVLIVFEALTTLMGRGHEEKMTNRGPELR